MVSGKTSSGFEFSVSENLKNDFRFVRLFAKLKKGKPEEQMLAPVELIELVFGTDGAEALYAHVAEEDGTIPTDRLMQELSEAVASIGSADAGIKN